MRAVVQDAYGPPEILRVDELPPPRPAAGEVLVRVRASSVNMADLDYLHARPAVARLSLGLRRPKNRIPGTDMAGVVETVGSDVRRWVVGDEVFADLTEVGAGAYAELVSVPESALTRKPASVTFEEAAAVPSSAMLALQGLETKGSVRPGDRVLVNGGGGNVGPFAIQMAKAAGAEVTGVDRTDKLQVMRDVGADHVIDYTAEDYADGEVRYERILDIAAHRPIARSRRALAPDGAYVVVGGPLRRFAQAGLLAVLPFLYRPQRFGVPMWKPNRREDMERIASMLESGVVRPAIDRRFSLDDIGDAMRYVDEGHAAGKVVITIGSHDDG